jgi:hypothetical protein
VGHNNFRENQAMTHQNPDGDGIEGNEKQLRARLAERELAPLGADRRARRRSVVPAHTVARERRRHDMRDYSVAYHVFDSSRSQAGGQR